MFALRHIPTNQLLGVNIVGIDRGSWVDIGVRISNFEDSVWVVRSRDVAEAARTPTKLQNSDYQSPTHNYFWEDLEVVELKVEGQSDG